MIVGIPDTYCTKDFIIRHFHEAYPEYEIDDVQVRLSGWKGGAHYEREGWLTLIS